MRTDRVSPGQMFADTPIVNSATQNAVLEATEFYQNVIRNGGGGLSRAAGRRDTNTVDVKNLTGGALVVGNVVQLGSLLLGTNSFDGAHFWLQGNTPSAPATARYAIVAQPMASNAIDEAFISGCCLCKVNVGDTDHTHAYPVASATVLTSGYWGPVEILSPLSSTGEQLVYGRLISMTGTRLKAVADAAITYDSSGTVSVWREGSDTGENLTAHLNWMHGDENIDSGSELLIEWFADEGKWIIVGADCGA